MSGLDIPERARQAATDAVAADGAVELTVAVHVAPIAAKAALMSAHDLLLRCADGREEYARGAPADQRAVLLIEARVLRCAARVAAGDRFAAMSLLPSWQWTPDLTDTLDPEGADRG